jgi:hypothetical protein
MKMKLFIFILCKIKINNKLIKSTLNGDGASSDFNNLLEQQKKLLILLIKIIFKKKLFINIPI